MIGATPGGELDRRFGTNGELGLGPSTGQASIEWSNGTTFVTQPGPTVQVHAFEHDGRPAATFGLDGIASPLVGSSESVVARSSESWKVPRVRWSPSLTSGPAAG